MEKKTQSGIIILLVIIAVALLMIAVRPSSNDNESTYDINKISTSLEGGNEFNVYVGGSGGSTDSKAFVEVTNNNQKPVCFQVYCENSIDSNGGWCIPEYQKDLSFCIEGNSKGVSEISIKSFIDPLTLKGSYIGNINVELVKYFDEKENDYIFKNSVIKAYPITINVYDNR